MGVIRPRAGVRDRSHLITFFYEEDLEMIPSSFLLLFCSLANVIAHLGKDIIGRPNFLPHPAEVKIMDGSFPSNPSYVIVQFSMDLSTCAAANVFAYYAYVLNTCVTSNSSSSSSIITCGKKDSFT